MSQSDHFVEGFPARDLRDAMNLYGLPGVADVVALEDMRGDGQDASGHTSVIPAKARLANALQRYNCICGQLWLCNHGAAPTTLKGDGLDADSGSAQDLIDYIGAIAMASTYSRSTPTSSATIPSSIRTKTSIDLPLTPLLADVRRKS